MPRSCLALRTFGSHQWIRPCTQSNSWGQVGLWRPEAKCHRCSLSPSLDFGGQASPTGSSARVLLTLLGWRGAWPLAVRGLHRREGGLGEAPALLGPCPRPLWFSFYQVIYPLKEIYPDSGELGLLGACPPSHRLLSAWLEPDLCLLKEAPARLQVSGWVPSPFNCLLFGGPVL